MLIQGSALSERTNILTEKYINLLENNVNADEILVLVQNSFKKSSFLNEVKLNLKITHFEEPQIYSFYGLAYNAIMNCWPIIENTINIGEPVLTPNLTGLEISQFFFRKAIKEVGFKDYNSKINLIHQLFRRNSLIVNNNLTDVQVQKRAYVLKEAFAKDAKTAIDIYKKITIEHRAFDYIRQMNIFNYIYKNTDYFKKIKYLIVDDADEITTAEFDFIKHLTPSLKEVFIGYDRHGSSRLGFLNTDVKTVEKLEKQFSNEEIIELDNSPDFKMPDESFSYTRRLEMIENALNQCSKMIETGISPQEICIVTPVIDSALKFAVSEIFEPKEIEYQYFSGSEKLIDDSVVKNVLTILNLSLDDFTDVFKIRSILNELFHIPLKYCLPIVENYKNKGALEFCDLKNDYYNEKLNNLVQTLEELKKENMLISEKLFIIYEKLINTQKELSQNLNIDIKQFSFLLKQIQDFEGVFEKQKANPKFQRAVLLQLENSIISENPSAAPEIEQDAVVITTAQKIIDFSIPSKYHVWLDTSSSQWVRDDFGTLYNAWVFQNSWDKESFIYEDNLELSQLKTKKMLRKLSLLAKEKIISFSSLYDSQGIENFGGIEEFIFSSKKQSKKEIQFNFIPRDDQKPVLDYKDGHMAISAVPGAGKTTILLALIIKLLQNNIKSENIFVLTYMDSAARNFKERIKKTCPSLEKLPNISTIHGLALRILKENSNFVKAGLDENFEVCDDTQRQRIIREILSHLQMDNDDYDKYEKAVSALKLSNIEQIPYTSDKELQKFLKFYYSYNLYLKNRNIIDYDDMLFFCVDILEKNKDIAEFYQNICCYVIEDEAQDSSAIQQKLLNILTAKHKNLIRCGDINQAITTTFTNTDLSSFRNFVNNSQNVTMNQSQRCAKDIYSLANRLVTYAGKEPDFKNAFFDIKMQEVAGKNPVSTNTLNINVFENYNEEKSYLLENIRKIFSSDKDATVAILVRNNYHIEEYSNYFSNYGYNVVTRSDTLDSQPIFSLIFALLKFCAHPWQNTTVLEAAEVLNEQKLLKLSNEDFFYLKELKTPFILKNQDEAPSENLSKLLWDLNFWLDNSSLSIEQFAIKSGNYYYNSEIEKSNVYITSLFLRTLSSQYATTQSLLEKLEEIKNKPISAKYKFFNDDSDVEKSKTRGIIQIMTYHKSKGDEFDYVFIPQLTDDLLPLEKEKIKIKSKERFLEAVKALNSNYKKKDENEQKLFQIEENLRLFYVAITRAKKKLYITSAKKYKKFSKIKEYKPSILFDTILDISRAGNDK